jgi:RNA:NAD 2'-phosphotransferase (TPT1/KptA family)
MYQKKQYNKKDEGPLVRVSKSLSYVLRHGAEKEGIPIRVII